MLPFAVNRNLVSALKIPKCISCRTQVLLKKTSPVACISSKAQIKSACLMKRKHCQKSRMNGRFGKILRESSKKRENIFVGVSSCAKGQKRVFCNGSAEKSSKKVVEIFGSLVKSPYFCTRFRERNPGREFKERIT